MKWFDPAEASVNRNLAQSTIRYGIKNDVPGTQIIGMLQRNDTWYKATQFGQDWKYWNDAYQKGARMGFVNRDARIGSQLYASNPNLNVGKYQTVMHVRGVDLETGDPFRQDITVVHSHLDHGVEVYDEQPLMTRGELEETALAWFDFYGLGEKYQVESVVPVMGFINEDF